MLGPDVGEDFLLCFLKLIVGLFLIVITLHVIIFISCLSNYAYHPYLILAYTLNLSNFDMHDQFTG